MSTRCAPMRPLGFNSSVETEQTGFWNRRAFGGLIPKATTSPLAMFSRLAIFYSSFHSLKIDLTSLTERCTSRNNFLSNSFDRWFHAE